jgi:VIT1/CCC1 family predicted Fe2+/Mn2+ transporter
MAQVHIEKHFTAGDFVRDVVIGMSDGLTVPFALAAGLSGAAASNGIVVTAGLAEIIAGSIAMGLGGYLAAKGDEEHYRSERRREEEEVRLVPDKELEEVAEIFVDYGLSVQEAKTVSLALSQRPEKWVDFMMRFELGLEEPSPQRASRSAATIAISYIVGGLVPLVPYMVVHTVSEGFKLSCVFTLMALGIFGAVKGRFTGISPFKGALQTVFVGGLASTAAFMLAKLFSHGA